MAQESSLAVSWKHDHEPFHALADLVEEHYVLTDRAAPYAATIRRLAADLDAANQLLHAHVPDRHLGLRRRPPTVGADAPGGGSSGGGPPPAAGFARVEQLGQGVALVALRPVFAGPAEAMPCLSAAAALVGPATGLILDLRECGGGDTDTAALIHGWLLGPEPVELGGFERRREAPVPYRSVPTPGLHFAGPVAVLTSNLTFSGGEDLAHILQGLGRARVVGEVTRGGAHPVDHFGLPLGYTAQIPTGRIVVRATGANWEGVGVQPDVVCSARVARSRALRLLRAAAPR